jgi:hypothetical protein
MERCMLYCAAGGSGYFLREALKSCIDKKENRQRTVGIIMGFRGKQGE